MDHAKILKRAWHIVLQYRVLWIFGLILALTTVSPGSQSSYRAGSSDAVITPSESQTPEEMWEEFRHLKPGEIWEEMQRELSKEIPAEFWGWFIFGVIALVVLGFVLTIVGRIAHYVSQVALIRMVNHYEETEEKVGFRQGWRLGWSRAAWRLFLINLATGIPLFVLIIILIGLALLPLLLWMGDAPTAGVLGTVATIGLIFLVIFFSIILGALVKLLRHFFFRACALENLRVGQSIRAGWAMFKQDWKGIGLMWIITAGINIGWTIVMVPVGILVFVVSLIFGGGAGLIMGSLINALFTSEAAAWVVAFIVGLPIFLVVLLAPMGLIGGWREVYLSSVWTLSYRELRALKALARESAPLTAWDEEMASAPVE
ncbi:MAG TPA: hypothetical protein PKH77_08255 [Anaerolineae bacterium]|nr:hypothetical protein [Anaerolineae bacterium]